MELVPERLEPIVYHSDLGSLRVPDRDVLYEREPSREAQNKTGTLSDASLLTPELVTDAIAHRAISRYGLGCCNMSRVR